MATAACLFAFTIPLSRGHRCAPHGHACVELVWNRGCRGRLHCGRHVSDYADDTFFLHQAGAEHWIENSGAGEQFCLGVSGCGAETLPGGVWALDDDLRERFEALRAATAATDPFRAERMDLLAGLLALSIRRRIIPTRMPPPSQIEAAKAILDERFRENVDVQDVAAAVFVSPDYLRQLFRRRFGESPLHYLIKKRLDHAQELLRITEDPVSDIAAHCGIANPFYFSRLFRKRFGLTPSADRGMFRTSFQKTRMQARKAGRTVER